MGRPKKPWQDDLYWQNVDIRGADECWPWLGLTDKQGYGRVYMDGRSRRAHRLALCLAASCAIDNMPASVLACHSCDWPPCQNPAHLWWGTGSDNIRDTVAKGRHRNARKTHCARGHEFTPENTYTHGRGERECHACIRERQRAHEGLKLATAA